MKDKFSAAEIEDLFDSSLLILTLKNDIFGHSSGIEELREEQNATAKHIQEVLSNANVSQLSHLHELCNIKLEKLHVEQELLSLDSNYGKIAQNNELISAAANLDQMTRDELNNRLKTENYVPAEKTTEK